MSNSLRTVRRAIKRAARKPHQPSGHAVLQRQVEVLTAVGNGTVGRAAQQWRLIRFGVNAAPNWNAATLNRFAERGLLASHFAGEGLVELTPAGKAELKRINRLLAGQVVQQPRATAKVIDFDARAINRAA